MLLCWCWCMLWQWCWCVLLCWYLLKYFDHVFSEPVCKKKLKLLLKVTFAYRCLKLNYLNEKYLFGQKLCIATPKKKKLIQYQLIVVQNIEPKTSSLDGAGPIHEGVCSGWLSRCSIGTVVPCLVRAWVYFCSCLIMHMIVFIWRT